MQIKTRVAGVLAVTTAAVAMIGGPAFASNSPSVGNVTGIANFSLLGGNNVEIPVNVPVNVCGVAVSFLRSPTPAARAARVSSATAATPATASASAASSGCRPASGPGAGAPSGYPAPWPWLSWAPR